mmetsp:Transcript_79178/g.203955  ORF Transcript_79178/g.203955 Transcript_79178/m.203955 type:complete len:248 (-) Transcript_79178:1153-1896(-)
MKPLKAKFRKRITKRSRKCSRSSMAFASVFPSCASFGCPRKTEKNCKVSTMVYQNSPSRWYSVHCVRKITRSSTSTQRSWYFFSASGSTWSPTGAGGSSATAVATPVVSQMMKLKFSTSIRVRKRVTQSTQTQGSYMEVWLLPQTVQHWRMRRMIVRITQTPSRRMCANVGYAVADTVSTWIAVVRPPLRSKSKRNSSSPNMGGSASALRKAVCTYSEDVAASSHRYALSMCSMSSNTACAGRPMSR